MFFKSKIKPDDFVRHLVREHQAIFDRRNFDRICKKFNLRSRDEASNIEGFYEFQAFGLYSISNGVRTESGIALRTEILTRLDKRFAVLSGVNWEPMRQRVLEYEQFGAFAPIGGFAAQRIFDRPAGVIQPDSKKAFDLTHAMNACYLDAMKATGRLFKQHTLDV